VWSERCTETSHFVYVFLKQEKLVQLVNFEKCHSPPTLVAQPDWDRVPKAFFILSRNVPNPVEKKTDQYKMCMTDYYNSLP
jgi:hypothetical protein